MKRFFIILFVIFMSGCVIKSKKSYLNDLSKEYKKGEQSGIRKSIEILEYNQEDVKNLDEMSTKELEFLYDYYNDLFILRSMLENNTFSISSNKEDKKDKILEEIFERK